MSIESPNQAPRPPCSWSWDQLHPRGWYQAVTTSKRATPSQSPRKKKKKKKNKPSHVVILHCISEPQELSHHKLSNHEVVQPSFSRVSTWATLFRYKKDHQNQRRKDHKIFTTGYGLPHSRTCCLVAIRFCTSLDELVGNVPKLSVQTTISCGSQNCPFTKRILNTNSSKKNSKKHRVLVF